MLPCCGSESRDKWDIGFFWRIVSKTDLRLVGLNCLGSVVWGVTTAGHQSSGIWAVWSKILNIRASTMEKWELRALSSLGKKNLFHCRRPYGDKVVQSTPDVQFNNERVSSTGLCEITPFGHRLQPNRLLEEWLRCVDASPHTLERTPWID